MGLDPLTAIGLVGNIVQFVDFGLKIVSKAHEVHNSSSGALSENVDTERIATDLIELTTSLEAVESLAAGDVRLQNLCTSCNEVANELLMVLGKLNAGATRTKWKSVRKALRTVWSKEKIHELEKRLTCFRDELNFRIVVDIRARIGSASIEQSNQYRSLDTYIKSVLDAIVRGQDLFQITTQQQTNMISAEITKTRSTIIGSIQALDEHAQEEQEHTRLGIIEFRSSTEARMRELREDMDKKHMELKNLLLAANKTHNTRQRGSLQERSKAVSAALVAYKVIYENLQTVLTTLQPQINSIIVANSTRDLGRGPSHVTNLLELSPSRISELKQLTLSYPSTKLEVAISLHYSYYYIPFISKSILGQMMHKWSITDLSTLGFDKLTQEEQSFVELCIYEPPFESTKLTIYCFVWLMATILLVLDECIPNPEDQFDILANVLDDETRTRYPGDSSLTMKLLRDMEMWRSIGRNSIFRRIIPGEYENRVELFNLAFSGASLPPLTMHKQKKDMSEMLVWSLRDQENEGYSFKSATTFAAATLLFGIYARDSILEIPSPDHRFPSEMTFYRIHSELAPLEPLPLLAQGNSI